MKHQQGFCAGDARIAVLPAATGAELGVFEANLAAQSPLLIDGFAGYRDRDPALGEDLKHTPVVQDERANAGAFFAIIHTLFSNIKVASLAIAAPAIRLDRLRALMVRKELR